jgi:peptidoglycan/LPS O-acetylase OafA/YrhL
MIKVQEKYFENLDGLRFLCFLSVFTVHTLHTDNVQIQSNFLYKIIVRGFFANGGIGVNFFFVLSGFLITYLLIQEKQSTGRINIINFWIKRVLRIWPLYFFCVLFGFVIFPFFKHLLGQPMAETADLKLYFLFLANFNVLWNGWPDSTELGVLWSISIEEQFYLIWPILLYLVPVRKYWIIFLGVVISSLIFRAFHNNDIVYYYHSLSCMSDMAIGGLAAWLMCFEQPRTWIRNLDKMKIAIIYMLFFLFYVFKDPLLNQVFVVHVFERLMISVLISLMILEQNYSMNSFYKMKNFKGISKLGLTTYGMYMLHIIAFSAVVIFGKLLKIEQNVYFIILVAPMGGLLLTIFMSKISYNFFEVKFLRLRKYLKK